MKNFISDFLGTVSRYISSFRRGSVSANPRLYVDYRSTSHMLSPEYTRLRQEVAAAERALQRAETEVARKAVLIEGDNPKTDNLKHLPLCWLITMAVNIVLDYNILKTLTDDVPTAAILSVCCVISLNIVTVLARYAVDRRQETEKIQFWLFISFVAILACGVVGFMAAQAPARAEAIYALKIQAAAITGEEFKLKGDDAGYEIAQSRIESLKRAQKHSGAVFAGMTLLMGAAEALTAYFMKPYQRRRAVEKARGKMEKKENVLQRRRDEMTLNENKFKREVIDKLYSAGVTNYDFLQADRRLGSEQAGPERHSEAETAAAAAETDRGLSAENNSFYDEQGFNQA
jgi:hypothetical protein